MSLGLVMGHERRQLNRRLDAAEGYLQLGLPKNALRELGRVPTAFRGAFLFNQLRADALRQLDRHEDALDAYRRANYVCPDDVRVLTGMAWCFKRLGRIDRAIELAEEAYHAAPDEAWLLYNLACYCCIAGDKHAALSWLGRAIRMESSLRKLISAEEDFDALRDDPDFQFIAQTPDVV